MSFTTSNVSAPGFSQAQARRAVQHMVLASVWSAMMAAPAKLLAALAEHRRVARTVAELEALSDRTLADIGISRGEIGSIARHGRDASRY